MVEEKSPRGFLHPVPWFFMAEVTRERPANPLERLIRGELRVSTYGSRRWAGGSVGCFRIDCTDDSWGSLHRWPPPQYSKPTRPTPWLEAYPYAEKRRDTARRTPYLGEIYWQARRRTLVWVWVASVSLKQSPADSLKNQNPERPRISFIDDDTPSLD